LIECAPPAGNGQRLVFYAPTRGLIGYQGDVASPDTRGTAVMNRLFTTRALQGDIQGRRNAWLISTNRGEPWLRHLFKLEDAARLMIEPGAKVIQGHDRRRGTTRDNDSRSTPQGKQLTKIRTPRLEDEAVRLTPPIQMERWKRAWPISKTTNASRTPSRFRLPLGQEFLDANDATRAEKARTGGGEGGE